MNDAAALQVLIAVRAARKREGAMAEAGVFRGGSARLICEAKGGVELHLFDVFETLAEGAPATPREVQIAGRFRRFHGVRDDVEQLLSSYPGVFIHSGVFPDAIPANLADASFSFVHIDLDLPDGIADALAFFYPRVVAGGIILADDFQDREVRDVFSAFFKERRDTLVEYPWGQLMIVKQA